MTEKHLDLSPSQLMKRSSAVPASSSATPTGTTVAKKPKTEKSKPEFVQISGDKPEPKLKQKAKPQVRGKMMQAALPHAEELDGIEKTPEAIRDWMDTHGYKPADLIVIESAMGGTQFHVMNLITGEMVVAHSKPAAKQIQQEKLSKMLGSTVSSLTSIGTRPSLDGNKSKTQLILEGINQGMTYKQIAAHAGCIYQMAYNIANKAFKAQKGLREEWESKQEVNN